MRDGETVMQVAFSANKCLFLIVFLEVDRTMKYIGWRNF